MNPLQIHREGRRWFFLPPQNPTRGRWRKWQRNRRRTRDQCRCWNCGAECSPAETYCTNCDVNWPGLGAKPEQER